MRALLVSVFQIKEYEKLDSEEERLSRSRLIYDVYIMKELLSCSHVRRSSPDQNPRSKLSTSGFHAPQSYSGG